MNPTHVVVDRHDGYVYWQGEDGDLFTRETATAFARNCNATMLPDHRKFALFLLVPAPAAGHYTLSDDGIVYPL